MKALKKILVVLISIILAIVLIAFVAWAALHVAKYLIYPDYYAEGEVEAKLPGLNDGFRPQGVFYDEESGAYIHSGSKGEHAALYVVDKNGSEKALTPLYNEKDERSIGRGGAVVRAGDYVYVCDNENQNNSINGILYIFRYTDIMNAKDGDTVLCIGRINSHCAMSAMFTDGNYLYVAEFYNPGTNYSTHKTHLYLTPEGNEQHAMLFAYKLNEDGTLSMTEQEDPDDPTTPKTVLIPAFALSLDEHVTGFAIKDGVIMLTRGVEWKYSVLEYYYAWRETSDTVKVSGCNVPIYYLDTRDFADSVKLPMCAGNMTLVGDRVAVTFESASNYYILGKFFFAYNLISFEIPNPN
ncbi:MAG: hypothetical protein IJW29_05150 [Clostridia bacterium]|nr:hypothetical protein [Clostridia bacterium]